HAFPGDSASMATRSRDLTLFGLLHSRCAFGIALALSASDRRHPGCGCSSVVEHDLAKVGVEGSSPFARSRTSPFFKALLQKATGLAWWRFVFGVHLGSTEINVSRPAPRAST